MVELQIFTENMQQHLKGYDLPGEQLRYTANPEKAIEKCRKDPDRLPVVIKRKENIVGFFVLHPGGMERDYAPDPAIVLLRAFSVNFKDQGKGYAAEALKDLPDFTRKWFPGAREMILGVNMKNERANELYLKNGWVDLGLRKMGREGEQKILHYFL